MKKYFFQSFSNLHLTDDISDPGDSGAWVVDATTGDLYGVIVAASTVMQEGYLIPASEITKDIRRATGVPIAKLPKRAAFSHAPQHLKHIEGIDGLFTVETAIDYRNNLKATYDRPGRTDHELRQTNAMQTSHLDVRQEGSHSGNTIASHSQISETELGKEHHGMLTSIRNMEEVLSEQSNHNEAEGTKEMVLSKEPANMLSMNNEAAMLSSQGKYQEAEKIHRQVLTIMETVLEKKHPDTLTSMNNLAGVLRSQGRYEEAERMFRQVLTLRERVLKKEHPSTLTSMNNLAETLSRQAKYIEAEEIYRQVLTLREMVLGKEHPDTLTSVYCLAHLLHQNKRYKDTEVFYRRAYAGYRKTLGEQHPTTAACFWHYSLMLDEAKG